MDKLEELIKKLVKAWSMAANHEKLGMEEIEAVKKAIEVITVIKSSLE